MNEPRTSKDKLTPSTLSVFAKCNLSLAYQLKGTSMAYENIGTGHRQICVEIYPISMLPTNIEVQSHPIHLESYQIYILLTISVTSQSYGL